MKYAADNRSLRLHFGTSPFQNWIGYYISQNTEMSQYQKREEIFLSFKNGKEPNKACVREYLKDHSSGENPDRPLNKLSCTYVNRSIFHYNKFANAPKTQPGSSQNKTNQQKNCHLRLLLNLKCKESGSLIFIV